MTSCQMICRDFFGPKTTKRDFFSCMSIRQILDVMTSFCLIAQYTCGEVFLGVTCHEENLPGRNTERKSLLIDFWLEMTLQIP